MPTCEKCGVKDKTVEFRGDSEERLCDPCCDKSRYCVRHGITDDKYDAYIEAKLDEAAAAAAATKAATKAASSGATAAPTAAAAVPTSIKTRSSSRSAPKIPDPDFVYDTTLQKQKQKPNNKSAKPVRDKNENPSSDHEALLRDIQALEDSTEHEKLNQSWKQLDQSYNLLNERLQAQIDEADANTHSLEKSPSKSPEFIQEKNLTNANIPLDSSTPMPRRDVQFPPPYTDDLLPNLIAEKDREISEKDLIIDEKDKIILKLQNAIHSSASMTHSSAKADPLTPQSSPPQSASALSLTAGSSLLRDIDESKLRDAKLTVRPGGKPKDLTRIFEAKARDNECYTFVNVVVGANRLNSQNPTENITVATQEIIECIEAAKKIAPIVRFVELPPRTNHSDMALAISQVNSEVELHCLTQSAVQFVPTSGVFYMRNGEPNDALLAEDGVHLNLKGSQYLLRFLDLERKDTKVSAIQEKAAYRKKRNVHKAKAGPKYAQTAQKQAKSMPHGHTGEKPYTQEMRKRAQSLTPLHTEIKPYAQRPAEDRPYNYKRARGYSRPQRHTEEKPYKSMRDFSRPQRHTGEKPYKNTRDYSRPQSTRQTGEKPYHRQHSGPPGKGGWVLNVRGRQAPLPPKPEKRATRACFNCGEANHMFRECRWNGPVTCHGCNGSGHKEKFCPLFDAYARHAGRR